MITMRSKKKDTGKDKQELPVGDFFLAHGNLGAVEGWEEELSIVFIIL